MRKPLPPSFHCPLCLLRSYHPKDIEHRFCARCGFVDDVIAQRRTEQEQQSATRATDSA